MNRHGSSAAWHAVLFALLAINTAWFALAGTTSKAVDAAAWLALLALFKVETGLRNRGRAPRAALRFARLVAAFGVFAATIGYVFEENVLDAINTVLWIAVVILLEIELRAPARVASRRRLFTAVAAALYTALALLVAIWAWRGEWFDAYDAALWLLAFAIIELDAMSSERASAPVMQN